MYSAGTIKMHHYVPVLKSKMAMFPTVKYTKWFDSCVTYDPKDWPTMQCHVGW